MGAYVKKLWTNGGGVAISAANLQTFDDAIDTIINGLNTTIKLEAGAGIDFSANASASGMTSEVLSDYEEGTWTPGITFGGAAVSITYSAQLGTYTKIGNRVFITGLITLSSKGSSVGDAKLTGLPFTIFSSSGNISPFDIGGLNNISFADFPQLRCTTNTTTADFYETTNAGARTTLVDTDFANNTSISFSGHYYV